MIGMRNDRSGITPSFAMTHQKFQMLLIKNLVKRVNLNGEQVIQNEHIEKVYFAKNHQMV